jgi:hypothetical protein
MTNITICCFKRWHNLDNNCLKDATLLATPVCIHYLEQSALILGNFQTFTHAAQKCESNYTN